MLSLQQLNQQTGLLPCCDCEWFFVNLAICLCHNYESIVGNTTLLIFMQLSVILQELYELQQLQAVLQYLKCDICKLFCWIYNRLSNSSVLLLIFFIVCQTNSHCQTNYSLLLFLQNDFVILTTIIKIRNYPVSNDAHHMYCKICKMYVIPDPVVNQAILFVHFYKIILFSLQKWLKFGILVEWCQLINWHKSFEVCSILIIILNLMINI